LAGGFRYNENVLPVAETALPGAQEPAFGREYQSFYRLLIAEAANWIDLKTAWSIFHLPD